MKLMDEYGVMLCLLFVISTLITILVTTNGVFNTLNKATNKRLISYGICEYKVDSKTGEKSLILIAGTNPGETWSKE